MKKQINKNPFDNLVLDEEEKLLEEAFERGEYEDAPDFENTKKMLEEAATRYLELNTAKPITIRINQLDLIKVKVKAKSKQIPYQTLIGSLIHQYAEGKSI
jgi:predicted DNA binding CopG/RHH family protein